MGTLKDILNIVSASDEYDDTLMELLKPEEMRREEAQEVYERFLGYDPTSFYDKKDIEECIEKFANGGDKVSESITRVIREHREEITEKAYENFDDSRSANIVMAVLSAISDVFFELTDGEIKEEWDIAKTSFDLF